MEWNIKSIWDAEEKTSVKTEEKLKSKQHTSSAYYELRSKYIYKRAHSELQLLNLINDKKLEPGVTYNFITSGDIDQMSYLSLVLRTFKKLDYLLFSTWCMASEDITYLFNLHEKGIIKKMDSYVGEIFKGSYPKEFECLKNWYIKYPIGRICLFRNHSKIFAGLSECGQGFGIQSSANINTNPRTENASITIDNGIFDFYKSYFDGIKSFE